MLKRQDIETFNTLTKQNAFPEAFEYIKTLLPSNPGNTELLSMAAKLAEKIGRLDEAAKLYTQLSNHKNLKPDDIFNIALKLKSYGQYQAALNAYQRCLDMTISQPEDVYLNMGVIQSDFLLDTKSGESLFKKALSENPKQLAAYINIGNLYDETGQVQSAVRAYEQALEYMPKAYEALARLANAQTITDPNHLVIHRLHDAVKDPQSNAFERECLYFALGNIYDTLQDYAKAFQAYQHANIEGKKDGQSYIPSAFEAYVMSQISWYSLSQANKRLPASENGTGPAPIFICGMFRSGSTLIEQVVSSHPDVSAKGELDFFANTAATLSSMTEESLSSPDSKTINRLRENYLTQPGIPQVKTRFFTDKRPDNFLYIGLIKSIFPAAKILHTTRNPLDTSLSTYFTQFGDGQAYARDLDHIAHYHSHQKHLMEHWKSCFPNDILSVSYDAFVQDSEATTRDVIKFLGLEWRASCLDFHTRKNRVKTASFKQVRRKLYTSSSGRWKNYEPYIAELIKTFETA